MPGPFRFESRLGWSASSFFTWTASTPFKHGLGLMVHPGLKVITVNARGMNNQIIRLLNAANDFGFAAATADGITITGGVLIVQSDAALGAAGNGLTLTSTNSNFRADATLAARPRC